MEITLTLSDELVRKLHQLPNPDEFVSEAIVRAFNTYVFQTASRPSKWARIVQRVQNDPVHLDGYSEQFKQDIREFRNHFTLMHDK
ncbi:hypothetical protein U27_06210 [Candidatus Vecturithrix granuli]|uniref:Uncharacterized protein n=1 Tax=Vecturithrix granuli TaxID=1499967 RepID=A0A081C3S8_VECG1|nr:hypothetical protein U27_06210 [Candidatus Vecturithrix granuli]